VLKIKKIHHGAVKAGSTQLGIPIYSMHGKQREMVPKATAGQGRGTRGRFLLFAPARGQTQVVKAQPGLVHAVSVDGR
jgi:hypothetical protein